MANATEYKAIAKLINKQLGENIVTVVEVDKGDYSGYFSNGVALQVAGGTDEFNLIDHTYSGVNIEIGTDDFYLEPWNMTLIGAWEA